MFLLIFSLVFFLFVALAFFIGAMRGRKYRWQLSLSRILVVLASTLVSALACSAIAMIIANPISKKLATVSVISWINNFGIGVSVEAILAVFIAMIIAALIFIPIFWIVRPLLNFSLNGLTRWLIKLFDSSDEASLEETVAQDENSEAITLEEAGQEENAETEDLNIDKTKKYHEFRVKKYGWSGAICGGICGFLTMFVMAIPVVGLLNTANDIISPATSQVELKPAENKVMQIFDASVNNVGAKTVRYAGGELVFDMATYCKADGNTTVTVKKDLADASQIVGITLKHGTLTYFLSDSQKAIANEQSTYELILVLLKNPRFNHTVDMISDEVIEGLLTKVNVREDKANFYEEFLEDIEAVKGTDAEMLMEEYNEVFDEYGIRVDEAKKQAAAHSKLAGTNMVDWAMENIAPDAVAFDSLTECISIDEVVKGEREIVNIEQEAKNLAHAMSSVCKLSGNVDSPKFDIKKMINELGPIFDAYSSTETVGPLKTEYMLMAILQSRVVHNKIGLTVLGAADSARSIYENAQQIGYTGMMRSLAKAVEVIDAASSDSKSTSNAVKAMLDDLTPSSARVIQTMSTPSVMRKYGVPEKSAKPVSEMVSDTFKNLSAAKENGMSDEQYQKEASAVSNMMDILMNTPKDGKAKTFGAGSVTGVSAKEYVNNIMDSVVMSGTIVDKVYVDGSTPSNDPLNSGRNMEQDEKDEFIAALTEKWNGSDKSEEAKKQIISIAAILNVQVRVTENAVQEIVASVQE